MSLRTVSGAILMVPVGLMAYSISLFVAHQSAGHLEIFHEPEPSAHELAQPAGTYVPLPTPAESGATARPTAALLAHKPIVSGKISVDTVARPGQVTSPAALDKLSWRVRSF